MDNIAPVRGFFESFVRNCQSSYCIGEYATLDEMLWAFRGRCRFRMYIPKKPARYGLKIFALTDSRTAYVANLEIYAGTQPDGPYKISNKKSDVVERMCEPIHNSGRNFTIDNWFSSIEVMKRMLMQYRLTIVGTFRRDAKGIPSEFTAKNREIYSSLFGFNEDMTIH